MLSTNVRFFAIAFQPGPTMPYGLVASLLLLSGLVWLFWRHRKALRRSGLIFALLCGIVYLSSPRVFGQQQQPPPPDDMLIQACCDPWWLEWTWICIPPGPC